MKELYRTFNLLIFFKIWISRIIIICLILIFSYHIPQNPIGFSIFTGIFLIILGLIFEDKIIVYNDRFVFSRKYLLNFVNIKKTFHFKDIKSADTENNGLADEIVSFLSNYNYGWRNHVWITFLNNEKKILIVWIDRSELNEVITIIRKRQLIN